MKSIFLWASLALLASCQKSWEQRCADEARETTRTACPQTLPNDLVMDSMTYQVAHNRFVYHYHTTGGAEQLQFMQSQQESLRQALQQAVVNAVELKLYKQHDMEFEYIYRDASTGQICLDFLFTPNDYNH